MRSILTFLFCLGFVWSGYSQTIQYSPTIQLDKTVDQFYYDSDFIYLKNTTDGSIDLEFTLVENTLVPEWNASLCTNIACYNKVPKAGSLGTITAGNDAYFLFSLGANEQVGEGQVRLIVTSPQKTELSDTVTFKYTVTEDGSIKAGPWANVNFEQGIFTVLLTHQNIETHLLITSLEGKVIFDEQISGISSFPLRDHPTGVYLYKVEDSAGRILKDKVLNF